MDKEKGQSVHSTADYAEYRPAHRQRSPIWRKIGVSLAALILIAALVMGSYKLTKHNKMAKKTGQTSQAASSSGAKITKATKYYSSTNFNLAFSYPADWSLSDSGSGVLTVRSPAVSLKNTSGQSVSAQITLTIRTPTQKLPEFDAGNAVAVLDSEKIAYTKPTQSQRADTYISFLQYASSASGLSGIYITGNNGYKNAQAIPKVDIQKVDPVIAVTFAKCANDRCTGGTTPLSISTGNWSDQAFAQPLKNLLQSFSIT